MDCWFEASQAESVQAGVTLHCETAVEFRHPLPLAAAEVVVELADGGEALWSLDDAPLALAGEPTALRAEIELSVSEETFPGLGQLPPLRFDVEVDPLALPDQQSPHHLTLPFDLWPIEITGGEVAVELQIEERELPIAVPAEDAGIFVAAASIVTVAPESVNHLVLAVPREQSRRIPMDDIADARETDDAGTAPNIGKGEELEVSPFDAPGHYVVDGDTVRPARFEDLAARLCVPPSIMMHSKDVDRLQADLIPFLRDNGYTPITYQDFSDIVAGRARRPDRPVIMSIDDVPTDFIRSQFKTMVEAILEEGMTVSLAVNTTAPADSDNPNHQANWDRLRGWQQRGVSLESHGTEHLNHRFHGERCLGGRRASCDMLSYLVEDSINALATATTARPAAMITPFGIPEVDDVGPYETVRRFVDAAGAEFIVGIPRGRRIEPAADSRGNVLFLDYPLFVGRVEIQETIEATAFEVENWYRNTPECADFEVAAAD